MIQCEQECRIRCVKQESLFNIFQKCPWVYYPRVRCHNDGLKQLVKSLKICNFIVIAEPRIQTRDGLHKPDIVAVNPEKDTVLSLIIPLFGELAILLMMLWMKRNIMILLTSKIKSKVYFCKLRLYEYAE